MVQIMLSLADVRNNSMHTFSWLCKESSGMKKLTVIFLAITLLGAIGCCGPSALERDYGNSWAYNAAVQIADPQAYLVQTPATGLNPVASQNVLGAYNKSFSGSKAGGGSQTNINLGGLTTAPTGGGSSGN
jgi:hypothetical protein